MEFMRKYIHVAKIVKPVLTQGAASHIAEEYSRLRSQEQLTNDVARTSPVTARSLETMIRLSTAHAKARMSKSIELQDAEVAVELVQFAYFKKVLEKEKKRRRQDDGDTETEGEDEEGQGEGGNEEATPEHRRKRSCRSGERRRPSKEGEVYDPYDFGDKEEDTPDVHNQTPKAPEYQEEPMETRGDSNKLQLADARLKEFKVALLAAFKSAHAQSISLHNLMDTINKGNEKPFSQGEVLTALEHMQDDNQVMVSDEIIFLI